MPTEPNAPVWQGPQLTPKQNSAVKNISSEAIETKEVDSIAAELKEELMADKAANQLDQASTDAPRAHRTGRRHNKDKKHVVESPSEQTAPEKPTSPDNHKHDDAVIAAESSEGIATQPESEPSDEESSLRLMPRSEGRDGQPGVLPGDRQETPEDTIYIDQDGNFKQRDE